MSLEFKIINPLEFSDWDNIIALNKNYTFFHSSIWAKVLVESYRYTPFYFTLFNNDKLTALIAIMEVRSLFTGRRGVSLPFSDYCEPIIPDEVISGNFFHNIIRFGKNAGWKVLEFRGGSQYYQNILSSRYYYIHNLELEQNEKKLFSGFRKSTQRNIKKAIKEGVKVNIHNSLESIQQFYELNCITRKYHGLPPQPILFFKKIFAHIISKHNGMVILASYNKKIIAGAVFFHFGDTAIFKYGASDRTYQILRPNNLIFWEAMKWYSKNGYSYLNFGRTEPANLGLLQFKEGWRPQKKILYYFTYDLENKAFIRKSHAKYFPWRMIFKKTPIPFLKAIGSISYKHIG